MPGSPLDTIEIRSKTAWRNWLKRHHATKTEIWLVFQKKHTGALALSYSDAIEQALCYGWVDSLVRRLDENRYARKFTPRKPASRWSTQNRQRYARLKANGELAAAGLACPPTARNGDAPRPSLTTLPPDIERALRADPEVWRKFSNLAPSCRRAYLAWIGAARREETKTRRLREALDLIRAGKQLGLK
ncbi:MAG: YdeI/OmpD-associated family protein [Planctomycetes bacterium]|nr:YdeI/OmpD-associated family protein [Planctomycetota bacterium]